MPGRPCGPLCPVAPGYPLGPFCPEGPAGPIGPEGPTTTLGLSALFTGLVVTRTAFGAALTTGFGFRFLGGSFFRGFFLAATFFAAAAFFLASSTLRISNERVLGLIGTAFDAVFALETKVLNDGDLRTDEVFAFAFFLIRLSVFLKENPNSP